MAGTRIVRRCLDADRAIDTEVVRRVVALAPDPAAEGAVILPEVILVAWRVGHGCGVTITTKHPQAAVLAQPVHGTLTGAGVVGRSRDIDVTIDADAIAGARTREPFPHRRLGRHKVGQDQIIAIHAAIVVGREVVDDTVEVHGHHAALRQVIEEADDVIARIGDFQVGVGLSVDRAEAGHFTRRQVFASSHIVGTLGRDGHACEDYGT